MINTKKINSNLSELNIFIFCEINNALNSSPLSYTTFNKLTYSSNHKSNNTIAYSISIEKQVREDSEGLEGELFNMIIDYKEKDIARIREYDKISITQFETELQVIVLIEYED